MQGNPNEEKSKWDMFDIQAKKRKDSRWDVFDQNVFADVRRRSSICDIAPDLEYPSKSPTKDVTFSIKETNTKEDADRHQEEEKQNTIIREMMNLIDRTNTGMVEFPEFIETITVKILKDAVTVNFRGLLII